ncbi:Ni/Fe hydrogenase subunit alpha [Anaeromyxobacter paludicola]|uniref:F420-non-reducing hydrogenase subunit A, selenocysteine-containing n=1 Tax=Anaeromyxobacter paludicola TaxID=2918171 RepID=A0ABM7XDI2_9BACT|nr:Ni/Fe hydrogenase subunit alpha [Anaeromyxobacter paludicola]BDG09929.1 F420-non-reducing hydrogenase subunit A, selenocysteine-containing [Anaeromyxobacter paludicola]
MSRRITIDPVTRLEGHGRIEIALDERGEVRDAWLQVPELRGFERFCVGRPAEEMPQLTAHVCGVCPAAHHLASARALDALYGAEPPPAAHAIRALYYHLFLLEDHALHFYYLGGPDLLLGADAPQGMRSLFGVVAALGKEVGERVVAARREARGLMQAIGGRTVHPVFALPGGISRPLAKETLERLRRAAPMLLDFAGFTLDAFARRVRGAAGYEALLASPAFRLETHSMGQVDGEGRLSFYGGRLRVVDPRGDELLSFEGKDYARHLAEHVEPWTYVKFPYLRAQGWRGFEEGAASGLYRVGPLARLNAAPRMATPRAGAERERLFEALGGRPVHQTLAFHWARLVEALQAAEAIAAAASDPLLESPEVRRVPEPLEARCPPGGELEGVGVVEAPRGTLVHHYRAGPDGLLTGATLLVASQHNAAPIQISVRRAAAELIHGGRVDDRILNTLEMAFRAYDPCNACASHALPGELALAVTIRGPGGEVVRRLARGAGPDGA